MECAVSIYKREF